MTEPKIEQDFSCCRKSHTSVHEEPENEYDLSGINWDDNGFLPFDTEVSVLVSEDNNNESDSDNPDDDQEVGNDQNVSGSETVDFDFILSTTDSDTMIQFPSNFIMEEFLSQVKENSKLDDTFDTHNALASRESKLLDDLKLNTDFLPFLKVQWYKLTQLIKEKKVTEGEKYQQKEFTDFCSGIYALSIDDVMTKDFSALNKIDVKDMDTVHYTACTEIIFGLSAVLLQILAAQVTGEIARPFISLENMSDGEKGKIRYVAGWTFRKVMQKAHKYIDTNLDSQNGDVRKSLKVEIMKYKILSDLVSSPSALEQHSEHKESLEVTSGKQNRSQGLTNVSDKTYLFFAKLEQERVNLLTRQRLNLLKGDVIEDALESMKANKSIQTCWQSLCEDVKGVVTEGATEKTGLFLSVVFILLNEIIMKYLKMGTGEFLRDFRREVQWQKSEAHRKKVVMSTQKKNLKSDQIKIGTIKADQSENKSTSHLLLKAMIQKHPRIFHETRLYTNKDIELLLKAYGVSKKGKKEVLADRLDQAINENECMIDLSTLE